MKNYFLLSIILFLSFFAPAWSADPSELTGFSASSAIDKTSVKLNEQDAVVQELLSQKFYYFGENLNNKIQEIRKRKSFKELTATQIKVFLETKKVVESKKDKTTQEKGEDNRVLVNVFVKSKDIELKESDTENKAFKKALLAATYFPAELEPRGKPLTIPGGVAHFKFIHRQLADALFYNHPLARRYLRESSSLCGMSLSSDEFYGSEFYDKIYNGDDEDLREYTSYPIRLPFKYSEIDKGEDEQLDEEEIDLPIYSKEMLGYFQGLLGKDQHPKRRKLK